MAYASIVIKVTFGETLRRFTAVIHDQKLALDVVTLREKIRSLFGFDSDVDFTLTYVDEDGDEVTLADDDDIQEVVHQYLNPLRITVKLNNRKSEEPNKTNTPLRSMNSGLSELLESVPDPSRNVFPKLPLHNLASKASSSSSGGIAHANGQKAPVDPEVGKSKSKKKEEVRKKEQVVSDIPSVKNNKGTSSGGSSEKTNTAKVGPILISHSSITPTFLGVCGLRCGFENPKSDHRVHQISLSFSFSINFGGTPVLQSSSTQNSCWFWFA